MGLKPRQQFSPMLTEWALLAGASWPYEQGAEILNKLTGGFICAKQVELLMAQHGKTILDEEAESLDTFYEGQGWQREWEEGVRDLAPESVYIELDGTMINSRDNVGGMEGKGAVIYNDKETVGKNRRALVNREYVGTYAGAKSLGQLMYRAAFRHGAERAQRIVMRGDGAPWVKELWQFHFPQAIFVLDWRHLRRKLWGTFAKLPEKLGDTPAERFRVSLKDALWHGRVDRALWALPILRRRLSSKEELEVLDQLMDYISDNREGINYQSLSQEGIDVGTGPVEKAIDLTICRRQKLRGMSWYRRRAEQVLAIRMKVLNDTWDDYWQTHSKLQLAV